MPTARNSVTFDIHDARVAPMISDDPEDGEPTYGTLIDVPGIQSITVEPEFITGELKGDARTLDRRGRTSAQNINVSYGMMSMDVLKVLFGGDITDTPTPEAVQWLLKGKNSTPYFKLLFSIEDVSLGLGNIICEGMKAQVTGGSLFDQSTDNYGSRSFQATCIPTLSSDEMFRSIMYSQLTTIDSMAGVST